MSDQKFNDWDPRDPAALADQRRVYDDMRNRCPVAHSDAMHWSLFRHADVVAVLDDPETFINSSRHHAIPNAMNGPEHAQHREILAAHFDETMMAEIEPRCRELALEAIRRVDSPGAMDAVADFAEPVALRTMCAFLGWPDEAWIRVRDWIHGNREATFRRDREAAWALAAEYTAMVVEALEDHRQRNIEDDVMGRLLHTEVDGQRWTDQEIVATLRNWIAGHGTVSAALGIVIAYLAGDQALQRWLRENPDLIPVAIEEILRMDGPLVANSRTTSRAVSIGGREIAEGERLSLMWIAANRDPEVFDSSDEVRTDRDQSQNLLYGHGIHYCLGAPLARLELRVAVEELLANSTSFTLAQDGPLERETFPGNGFVAVPIQVR